MLEPEHHVNELTPHTPESPGIYATLDGYVTPTGYGYYNRDAQLQHFDSFEAAEAWLAEHSPDGQQLTKLVATDRSDHPLGWFSMPADRSHMDIIAQAVIQGFQADIGITIYPPGSMTDHDNSWVSLDQEIYVPQWEPTS